MSEEELIGIFEFTGQHPTRAIIEKCLEICSKYSVDAEDLVDHWSAFSMTNLKNAPISLEGISSMEQKIFNNKQATISSQDKSSLIKTQEVDECKKSDVIEHTQTLKHDVADITHNESIKVESKSNEEEDIKHIDYKNRKDAGVVVVSFGKIINHVKCSRQTSNVTIYGNSEWYKEQNFRGLYVTQTQIANRFDNHINNLGQIILKRNNIEISNTEGNFVAYGRIKSEDGRKISVRSIMLETSREFNGSKEVILSIDNLKSYSLFSGQIVVVRGITMAKNSVVQEIYSDASPEFASETLSLNDNLRIVVAAGPFTFSDNLFYDPLSDLLEQVKEQKPNVLILIGPFTDSAHPDFVTLNETYAHYFETQMDNFMDCLASAEWPMQVVLVPSFNDPHHFPCYPTPSYTLKEYPNLNCVPNPCLLNIHGIIIGISSLDILFQLTKEEISKNVQTDRISRLAAHILYQRNFYPIYPNREHSVPIDYECLLSDCTLDVKPHLLILPSTLRHFIKNVDGCLVVNPERLTKNHIGGTYAIIDIKPPLKTGCIIDCITCKIKKI
ncbi:hypothetical protein Trydic_g11191 [Trypoxylus dichotomus]